jgi:Flp pilus assembly pilin Flp
MGTVLRTLWSDRSGEDLTEYALLLVLISLAVTASLTALGSAVSDSFSNASGQVGTETGP